MLRETAAAPLGAGPQPVTKASLMVCGPGQFGVEYAINPWMRRAGAVDTALARAQWERLVAVYAALGAEVTTVEPGPGLPDMVFSADAGFAGAGWVVPAAFRHPERQREEPHWRAAFARLGLDVRPLPPGVRFEGGD